jgi:hypothetical protein
MVLLLLLMRVGVGGLLLLPHSLGIWTRLCVTDAAVPTPTVLPRV